MNREQDHSRNNEKFDSNAADILVVDDTPDNVRLLSKILMDQGYTVRKALNGTMALTAVQSKLPDLILLDISMPGMNGYEVCEALKKDIKTVAIPIIFLSAFNDVSDKVKAFEVGGLDYITKPFQYAEVLVRIKNQLTIKNLQNQLQNRNEELQQALTQLRSTQAQLIQKEKMIGLGQIVAGISHEINNPISFIAGNLSPARQYIRELLHLIEIYQNAYPNPESSVQEAIEEIDLNFMVSDLQNLMGSMQTGVDRIRSIILALRIFSHLGESDIKSVDLQAGIDSTLMLLQHRLMPQSDRPEIKVVKSYHSLPPVTCHASQINQVFLNLLTNAIDALESQEASKERTIWIRTEVTPRETVLVSIQDNGPGIPDKVRSRIFDPFFTTKAANQGSGLGLTTSYQIIVEKHKGNLICHSSPQEGAEFIVEIPINQRFSQESISSEDYISA